MTRPNAGTDSSDGRSRLSEPQKLAVDWDDGAFLLIAGPGSGKTSVVTERIVRILNATPEENFRVLALTFTNRAADEMRDRISGRIEALECRAFVGTFHSFCTEILHQYGHELGLKSDFRIYSMDRDREEILKEVLRGLGSEKRDALSKLKLLPTLDRVAGQMLLPSEVEARFRQPETGAAVAAAYEAYHAELLKINAQDFPALVLNTYKLMHEFPVLAKRVRATYRYWHIDEFQDTTSGQFKLIRAIAHNQFRNVFAVADDDQIIYQWNGASHKRLDEYIQVFSPEVLQLPTNYRCPEPVVALANNLICHNQFRSKGKKPLIAARTADEIDSKAVELLRYSTDDEEASGIAQLICSLSPESRRSVAVLARARASLIKIKDSLDAAGIRSRLIQRRDTFQTDEFVWIHCALALTHRRQDEKALRAALTAFNNLAHIDVSYEDVLLDAKVGQQDYLTTWLAAAKSATSPESLSLLDAVEKNLLRSSDYRSFVDQVIALSKSHIPLEREGLVSPFEEDRQAWSALTRDARSARGASLTLDQFLQELELRPKEPPLAIGEVPLMTIHAAKGNEFQIVYLVGLAEGVLPSFQSLEKGDQSAELEEERRNCFVAITRTQGQLVLSYANKYRGWKKEPSRFLREMELLPT